MPSFFFQRSYYKQVSSLWSIYCRVFCLVCFLLLILLFKMTSKHSVEMPSRVSKNKKAVLCLIEKVLVLDKLFSGMRYSAIGHEFSVTKSTIYIN